MQLPEIMTALEKLGTPQTKKTWLAHGATGELFGVKIGDMKTLIKKLPKDKDERQTLALSLYETGNLDAMYMAGLMADGAKMSRRELEQWANAARWSMLSEWVVPWNATESPRARELARAWTDSKKAHVACAGWGTWAGIVSTKPDEELDLKELERLLARVEKEVGSAQNRVRYSMNYFVIAVGCFVKPLLAKAKATAKRLGNVAVDVGDTNCKVPNALAMIEKIESMGRVGKKRKTMKC